MRKVLLVASLVAFALVGCKNNGVKNEAVAGVQPVQEVGVYDIAYVNMDSLMARYDYVTEKGAEVQAKADKVDKELTSKRRSLEAAVADANEKVQKGLVTRAQAAELEENLGKRQQNLEAYYNNMMSELAEDQQVMNNNIYNNLMTFLEEFNADYKYKMILTTSGSAPILHADPALDITDQVVEGLNAKYAAEKKASK